MRRPVVVTQRYLVCLAASFCFIFLEFFVPFNSCNFGVFRVFPFWLSSCLHISHSCVYLSACCQREQPKCLAERVEGGGISPHARRLIKYFRRNENENILWSIHAKLNIILMCVLCFPAHLSR